MNLLSTNLLVVNGLQRKEAEILKERRPTYEKGLSLARIQLILTSIGVIEPSVS